MMLIHIVLKDDGPHYFSICHIPRGSLPAREVIGSLTSRAHHYEATKWQVDQHPRADKVC